MIARNRVLLGIGLGVLTILVVILIPVDRALLARIQLDTPTAESWARRLSEWGQFEYSTLLIAVVLWSIGKLGDSARLRRAGALALIAGLAGGLLVNVFRPTFGRARPSSGEPDGFHGPSLSHDYHSFPSGHACSTASTAGAILCAFPPATAPAAVFSVAVAWSRLERERHHLSDVIVGLALGGFVGWVVAGGRVRATSVT